MSKLTTIDTNTFKDLLGRSFDGGEEEHENNGGGDDDGGIVLVMGM